MPNLFKNPLSENQKTIVRRWIAALRSGDYEQGRGSLRKNNAFCCLGVLCDVLSKQGSGHWDVVDKIVWGFRNKSRDEVEAGNGEWDDDLLPPFAAELAGLDTCDPRVNHWGVSITLSELNDSGANFEEIANLIEERL